MQVHISALGGGREQPNSFLIEETEWVLKTGENRTAVLEQQEEVK